MKLDVALGGPADVASPLTVVGVSREGAESPGPDLESLDRGVGGMLARATAAGDFRGREGERLTGYRVGDGGPERVLFLGVGRADSLDRESFREAAGVAVRAAEELRLDSVAFAPSSLGAAATPARIQAAAEGLTLASWRFDELKSGEPPPSISAASIVAPRDDASWTEAVAAGRAFARGENLARTLQARPGNVATPKRLADEAARIAAEVGLACDVLGPDRIRAEGMGALLSVAQGSDRGPRVVVLKHSGGAPGDAPLALVGKGLTFDAGGISLKPAKGMEDMKYDMSGGAAVLGAMQAVGELWLPANVVAIVPSAENLPSGSATKPGDVIRSRADKTVEVINTDAEGRLILADALHYALDWNPAAVVDCATLTGACVVALGRHRSAVLGNDRALVGEIRRAGDRASQPAWPLPLDGEYRKLLDSDFADLKNVGGRPAGAITAACFLAEFVGETPWAHLDVAGTAYGKTSKSYLRDGPAGNPCRLLLEWVRARAGA